MKKMKTCCALLGIATALSTSSLFAGINYGDTGSISIHGNGGAQGGGPFTGTTDFGTFTTFCLELNEELGGATTYTVNSGAVNGGVGWTGAGGSSSFDPLSIGAAYIFSQFNAGAAGYTDATLVQQAIWYLEDEITLNSTTYGVNNSVVASAQTDLGISTDLKANSDGAYGVVVLNLTGRDSVNQDVLAQVPEPSTVVAGALLLLPFGVSTLRILRKNKLQ